MGTVENALEELDLPGQDWEGRILRPLVSPDEQTSGVEEQPPFESPSKSHRREFWMDVLFQQVAAVVLMQLQRPSRRLNHPPM